MALSSNEKRAQRRQQCREALADHIHKRLGLHIAPSEVRLQPSQDDGYAWSVTDRSAHLLQGSLSNGSVGRYDAICAELGVSIEAVRPEVLGDNGPTYLGEDDEPSLGDESFTAVIQRLSLENEKLKSEIGRIQRHAETMSHTCSRWEAKYRKLEEEGARQERSIASLQEGLRFARDDISQAIRLLQRHQSRNETPLGTGSGAVPLCR
ncbi:hypothetical protein ASPCAL14996 [Aspergillus calidoustus]|uniref:Uncharacterized protein n=1 Tax=Aspergillus calidoustus TaxID=454130 RepID=A0A0U5GM28_ASPCI|nr:hypothetical protein ASPCAL14996 [Aspergillus calidoustus]